MNFKKMAKRFWTLSKAREGFTLVELIVVIAIMAILAGVAVPAYTGYINKANKASDLQLLGAINTAFGAAVMEDLNMSTSQLPDGYAAFVTADKTVTKHNDTFQKYFAGNTAEFKVIKLLAFKDGVFVEASEAYSALVDYLKEKYPDAIDDVTGSIYPSIGYDNLAGNIDTAALLIAGLTTDGSSAFTTLLLGDDNFETLYGYYTDEEGNVDEGAVDALFEQKYNQLKNDPKYADWDDDKIASEAENQVMANVAVLTAASNASAVTEDFITAMGNGTAVDVLKGSLSVDGNATEDTIAQSAFAYAMYTSYAASRGMDTTGELDLQTVYNVLGTTDFQKYMNEEAEADIAGYQGAMTLIQGSAGSVENSTINDILLNGFNNPDLVGLMQNVGTK